MTIVAWGSSGSEVPSWGESLSWGYQRGSCRVVLLPLLVPNIYKANVFINNDTPPRACLADFGFITMAFDSVQPMSCSMQFEGGTTTFISPELLAPSRFGKRESVPTPEADIYAFGMVIFQVCEQDPGCDLYIYTLSRSLRVRSRSVVFGERSWGSQWFKGCAQTNQRTPHPLDFPTYCGVSSDGAGMAT